MQDNSPYWMVHDMATIDRPMDKDSRSTARVSFVVYKCFSSYLHACVYGCAYVFTDEHEVYACMGTGMWKLHIELSVLLHRFPPSFLKHGLSLILELTDLASVSG